MDRYAFSGVAFSAAKPNLDAAWCAAPDSGLPAPDIVIFMDLPPEAQSARGGFGGERYEVPAFQLAVRAAFSALRERVKHTISWSTLNAAGTIEEVEARVTEIVEPTIQMAATSALKTLWENVQECSV
jgi:dTMP kinase